MKLLDIVILLKDTDKLKAGTEGVIVHKYSRDKMYEVEFKMNPPLNEMTINLSEKEIVLKENTTKAIWINPVWQGVTFKTEVTECCNNSVLEFDQKLKKYCSQCGKYIIYPKEN